MVYAFLIHIARLDKLISSICLVVVPLVLSSPGTKSLMIPRKKDGTMGWSYSWRGMAHTDFGCVFIINSRINYDRPMNFIEFPRLKVVSNCHVGDSTYAVP